MACVASVVTLCLFPVADQVRGPVTSRGDGDPFEDGLLDLLQKNELVAALPGHLMVGVHSEIRLPAPTCSRPPIAPCRYSVLLGTSSRCYFVLVVSVTE
ncbi:hypothetical protein ABZ260_04960 [Streptosporangium sp. NPDC006013]|uniref:hypothetical protein n=1 Tax=Streptosporangium sp. NPDC006013 TaxID=3155596 RepID=UPI0033A97410